MDKILLHKQLCDQLNSVYKKKNEDYGDSFGKSVAKRGITAAMVRLEDKWNRLDNLTLNPNNIQVKDESIGDTLLDMANYCLMTYLELYAYPQAATSTVEVTTTPISVCRDYYPEYD